MSKNLMIWIVCVVAADIVVTTLVTLRFLAKRRANPVPGSAAPAAIGGAVPAIPGFFALRKFSEVIHPRIGEILRSSWSGDPESLPAVLTMALDEAEGEARNQGLPLDRAILKKLVETSVARHNVTKSAVLHEAFQQVA